jgi:hypothetical protein
LLINSILNNSGVISPFEKEESGFADLMVFKIIRGPSPFEKAESGFAD